MVIVLHFAHALLCIGKCPDNLIIMVCCRIAGFNHGRTIPKSVTHWLPEADETQCSVNPSLIANNSLLLSFLLVTGATFVTVTKQLFTSDHFHDRRIYF